ncbi:hypothetical protein AB0D78_37625 [Streptomyces avermitilis]|uniref:hypothetical protein n=1 Tax=Streptomyces avermitilis TaxID=33903 RepID=UPI0033F8205D
MTALPDLSSDHIGPLAEVVHEAIWHPHIAGRLTPEEKAQRFAARVRAHRTAGRPEQRVTTVSCWVVDRCLHN